MPRIRTILLAVAAVALAYQFAPDKLLPVPEGAAVVVTGSHTGIGRHAALSLAREGFTVFSCVRKEQHGQEIVQEAKDLGIDPTKIKPLLLDVTNEEQILAAVETVSQVVGDRGLHGLFNNAGVFNEVKVGEARSVEYMPMETVRWIFDINFFGLQRVTQAFLPLLRKGHGRIISNTSVAGIFAGSFLSAYSASKFAVEALMDSLRRETFGMVHVSILEPGYVSTPIFNGARNLFAFQDAIDPENNVYAHAELRAAKNFMSLASQASHTPKVTSDAVIHAMRAERPKIRYLVGGQAGLIKAFSLMPASWPDAIVWATKDHDLPMDDAELKRLLDVSNAKFEL